MKVTRRNLCLSGIAMLVGALALLNFSFSNGRSQTDRAQELATPTEPLPVSSGQTLAIRPLNQPQPTNFSALQTTGNSPQPLIAMAGRTHALGTNPPGAMLPAALGTTQGLQMPEVVPLASPVIVPPEVRVSGTVPQSGTNRDFSPP
jgi:hypothetical protein